MSEMLGAGFNDGDGMDPATASAAVAQIEMAAMNVSLPVRVLAFDAAKNQVRVQPVVMRVDPDGVSRAYPPISACPVQWPCGGGFSITWPLAVGDTGLLVFASAAIDQWITTGSEQAKPTSGRRGALSDGVFIPGLRPRKNIPATIAGGGLSVGKEDSTARLHISAAGAVKINGASILFGDTASGHAAIAELIDAHFTAQKVWLDAHTHTSGGPGSPTSTPVLPSPTSPTPPATVGSSLVEIE